MGEHTEYALRRRYDDLARCFRAYVESQCEKPSDVVDAISTFDLSKDQIEQVRELLEATDVSGGEAVNLEVVKRAYPCRWFASDPTPGECRSCVLATHVRPEGTDRTYCGHECPGDAGWMALPDTHPEDIDQLDRCAVCYSRIPQKVLVL